MKDEKTRPNAKYKLSNTNYNPDEITYHYNRERRLEKAPQSVKDLYAENPKRRFSLFGTFVGNKSRAFTFISIVIISIMIMLMAITGSLGDSLELERNLLDIQAQVIRGENAAHITIRKTARKGILAFFNPPYTGFVDIEIFPAGSGSLDDPPYHRRIRFTNEEEQYIRFSVPAMQSSALQLIFRTEKSALHASVFPE